MLIDHEKGKNTLVAFESREWVILLFAIFFSVIEIFFSRMIFKLLEKLTITQRFILSLLISFICSVLVFIISVFILSRFFNYLFADLSIVFSGIFVSGILSLSVILLKPVWHPKPRRS